MTGVLCLCLIVIGSSPQHSARLCADEWKARRILQGHTEAVWLVAFSPHGKTLATASVDKTVKLWDTATGKERATLRGHTDIVFSVAYSPDGKTLGG